MQMSSRILQPNKSHFHQVVKQAGQTVLSPTIVTVQGIFEKLATDPHRQTQTKVEKDIHKKSVTYVCFIMNNVGFPTSFWIWTSNALDFHGVSGLSSKPKHLGEQGSMDGVF